MFQLDLKSGVSICDQIVNGFIRLKALGAIKGGEQMPSVRVLASRFSVNPNTVQKAYAILEANGIIYSVKGKGSFMSDDEDASFAIKIISASPDEMALDTKNPPHETLPARLARPIIPSTFSLFTGKLLFK